jgi:hypothetical protein
MADDSHGGGLSAAEASQLEGVSLPALQRQHLRLLAHSLRSLQAAAGSSHGPLPSRATLASWAASQPALKDDSAFQELLVDQLIGAGVQLQDLAAHQGLGDDPLSISLEQLIEAAVAISSAAIMG